MEPLVYSVLKNALRLTFEQAPPLSVFSSFGRKLKRFKQVFVTLVSCDVHQDVAQLKAPDDDGKEVELMPEYLV